MIEGSTVIRRNPRTAFRDLSGDQGAVLLHLDTAAYHSMNEVGTAVWNLLEEDRTFSELIVGLRAQLDEEPPSLEDDIKEFLHALEGRDLIRIG